MVLPKSGRAKSCHENSSAALSDYAPKGVLCGFWAGLPWPGGAGEFGRGRVRFAPCAKVSVPYPISIVPLPARQTRARAYSSTEPFANNGVDFRRFAVGCKLRGASSNNAAAQCHSPPGSMHCPPAPDAQTYKNNETLHNNNRQNRHN